MAIIESARHHPIIVGVDAHKHTHHAAVLSPTGALLGDHEFAACTQGYEELAAWLATFGEVQSIGVESTGSYAAGLTRFLRESKLDVREINRPHAHLRAQKGKTDPLDAEAAARKVLSGAFRVVPKDTTGPVESIRLLSVTRASAVKARSNAINQLKDVLVTVPASLRESLEGSRALITVCSNLRPDMSRLIDPTQAAKCALRTLARRIRELSDEISQLERELDTMVRAVAPTLISKMGIGPINAAELIVTAGQNFERITSDAAFARLCGAAPIPASSGQTQRMRLHRGGHRQANRALHMIAVVRLRYDKRTRDYMARRTAEGLSKRDVIRCLKRYIAREVYNDLKLDLLGRANT